MGKESCPADVGDGKIIACTSCKACCCRLEVLLMGGDDVASELIAVDRWGGQVMARLDDGWCAALDRNTMLCGIYDRRPMICREYQVGGSDCLTERKSISDMVNDAVKASLAEDADDLATFSARKNEKSLSFDTFVQGLKPRGRI